MAIAMKSNEAPNPVDVGLLSANAVMLEAYPRTHEIEQAEARGSGLQVRLGRAKSSDLVDDAVRNVLGIVRMDE